MTIEFDEKTHTYIVDGDIAGVSVTELLAKHRIAPDYSGVNKDLLQEKAQRGKQIHKDLENTAKNKAYKPKTAQGKQFAEWLKENSTNALAETPLAINYNGLIIAGTCDIIVYNGTTATIGDHKCMAKIHKDCVAWQLSIYDYILRSMGCGGADNFVCFHYGKDDSFEVVPVEKVPDAEIEKLFACELSGKLYQPKALVVADDLRIAYEKAECELIALQEQEKLARKNADELRAKILQVMEMQGIKSWETDTLKITYVAEQEKKTVDGKKLQSEFPEIYVQCQKTSKSKAYLKITVKEGDL